MVVISNSNAQRIYFFYRRVVKSAVEEFSTDLKLSRATAAMNGAAVEVLF